MLLRSLHLGLCYSSPVGLSHDDRMGLNKEGRHTEKRSDVVINQVKSFSKQFPLPFAYRRTLAKRHALASNDKRFPRSRIHSTAGKEMSYKASLVSKSVRLSNATRVHNLTVQISKAQQLNLSAGPRFIHER